jgi:hypothetical protein
MADPTLPREVGSSIGTQAKGHSETSSVSADGRFLAFASTATNLVDGDTNGQEDVFLRDLATGTTTAGQRRDQRHSGQRSKPRRRHQCTSSRLTSASSRSTTTAFCVATLVSVSLGSAIRGGAGKSLYQRGVVLAFLATVRPDGRPRVHPTATRGAGVSLSCGSRARVDGCSPCVGCA